MGQNKDLKSAAITGRVCILFNWKISKTTSIRKTLISRIYRNQLLSFSISRLRCIWRKFQQKTTETIIFLRTTNSLHLTQKFNRFRVSFNLQVPFQPEKTLQGNPLRALLIPPAIICVCVARIFISGHLLNSHSDP